MKRLLHGQGARRRCQIVPQKPDVPVALRIRILLYEKSDRSVAEYVDLHHRLSEAGHRPRFAAKDLHDLGMDPEKVARFVASDPADCWVVCGGSTKVLEWFAGRSTPVFAFFGRHATLPIAGATPQKIPALLTAVRRLVALGHRRIVMLVREERRKPEPALFEQSFLDELGRHGVPDRSLPPAGLGGHAGGFPARARRADPAHSADRSDHQRIDAFRRRAAAPRPARHRGTGQDFPDLRRSRSDLRLVRAGDFPHSLGHRTGGAECRALGEPSGPRQAIAEENLSRSRVRRRRDDRAGAFAMSPHSSRQKTSCHLMKARGFRRFGARGRHPRTQEPGRGDARETRRTSRRASRLAGRTRGTPAGRTRSGVRRKGRAEGDRESERAPVAERLEPLQFGLSAAAAEEKEQADAAEKCRGGFGDGGEDEVDIAARDLPRKGAPRRAQGLAERIQGNIDGAEDPGGERGRVGVLIDEPTAVEVPEGVRPFHG